MAFRSALPLASPSIDSWKLILCILQRTLLVLLTLPPMASKVEPQMAKARRDIEKKLVPSGPQVVRHLSLPPAGQSTDWILAEMDRMDSYCHSFDDRGVKLHDWKDGKISGAVYRELCHHRSFVPGVECMRRWRTRLDEPDCRRVRTLLCFQSIASGRVPNY